DEEDLDSAFIQAAYKVPQKNGEAAGRARLGSSTTVGAAGRNNRKAAAKSMPKLKLKSRDDAELKVRSTGGDGSLRRNRNAVSGLQGGLTSWRAKRRRFRQVFA